MLLVFILLFWWSGSCGYLSGWLFLKYLQRKSHGRECSNSYVYLFCVWVRVKRRLKNEHIGKNLSLKATSMVIVYCPYFLESKSKGSCFYDFGFLFAKRGQFTTYICKSLLRIYYVWVNSKLPCGPATGEVIMFFFLLLILWELSLWISKRQICLSDFFRHFLWPVLEFCYIIIIKWSITLL